MSAAIVPIVTALITAAGMWLVQRVASSATARDAITAPYRDLVDRVTQLEDRDEEKSRIMARLRDHLEVVIRDRDNLVSYIKALSAWVAAGAKPPAPPVPTHLHDLLDPSAFDVAQVTEITTTTTTTQRVTPSPEEGQP